jgi:hypothetical protein
MPELRNNPHKFLELASAFDKAVNYAGYANRKLL